MQLVLLLCLALLASHPAAQQQQQRLHDRISKWGGSSGIRSHRGDSSVDRSSSSSKGSSSDNGSSRSSGGGRRYSSDDGVESGSGSNSRRVSDSSSFGGRGSRKTGISISSSRGVSNSGSSGSDSGRFSKSSERQVPPAWVRSYAWPLKQLPPYRACEESDMCRWENQWRGWKEPGRVGRGQWVAAAMGQCLRAAMHGPSSGCGHTAHARRATCTGEEPGGQRAALKSVLPGCVRISFPPSSPEQTPLL